MVPWRATDDGFVTPDVHRLVRPLRRGPARRDRRRGDRHPRRAERARCCASATTASSTGCAKLVDGVQRGERRRDAAVHPADRLPARSAAARRATSSSRASSRSTERHREALARIRDDERWLRAPDDEVRARARRARPTTSCRRVLDARELEALERGYRERVTDIAPAAHRASCRSVLPDAVRRRRGARARRRLRRRRAALRARLHDGVVPLGAEHARRRLRRLAREPRAAAARGRSPRCARASAPRGRRLPLPRRRGDRGRQPRRRRGVVRRRARARRPRLPVALARAASSRTRSSRRSARPAYPYTGPTRLRVHADDLLRRARPVRAQRAARRRRSAPRCAPPASTTPIVAAGGIYELRRRPRRCSQRGEADIVASARQSLADPDWFLKIRLGRGAEVRRCEFTNYCEALDQQHKQVTCKLWDREELDEPDVTLAADGKRRLIAPRWRR